MTPSRSVRDPNARFTGVGDVTVSTTARVSTADPGVGGSAFTFQVVAAVIIGGTSLFGGIGTIVGAALGSLLFTVINNALALTDANPLWQNIAVGVILVVAVAFDQLRRSRQFTLERA